MPLLAPHLVPPSPLRLHPPLSLYEPPCRLEAIDCSQRALPSWLAGGSGDGEGGDVDDGMGDFMAEILAEEVSI